MCGRTEMSVLSSAVALFAFGWLATVRAIASFALSHPVLAARMLPASAPRRSARIWRSGGLETVPECTGLRRRSFRGRPGVTNRHPCARAPFAAMDTSFRSAQRCLAALDPLAPTESEGAPLESWAAGAEPARLVASQPLEGRAIRARRVEGASEPGFHAFLDGTQQSRVLGYVGGVPVVFGTVASVVRVRVDRRLFTWSAGPRIDRRVYAPLRFLEADLTERFAGAGIPVADTAGPEGGDPPPPHPLALLERAVHLVQQHRELAERQLAELWCNLEGEPIYVDGSIDRSEVVARSPCAVGVVKSHRSLYVDGEALGHVLSLRAGERSTVFSASSARRTSVASWYLRLRDSGGHDPLWGLVRVEAADPRVLGESAEGLTARADRVSRWVLAEAAPLALPDGRWDRMAYGIRDCEEFLRAVT